MTVSHRRYAATLSCARNASSYYIARPTRVSFGAPGMGLRPSQSPIAGATSTRETRS